MLLLTVLCLIGTAFALPVPETEDDWSVSLTFNSGKREVEENLFDDILKAVQVATPIITTLASGKRETEDDWSVSLTFNSGKRESGKREAEDGFSFNIGPVTVTLGEDSDNLFDDILKAVQVATPIVTALAGKRDVADSEWFDTFLAAVEAATPTIVGVIQGAGTA